MSQTQSFSSRNTRDIVEEMLKNRRQRFDEFINKNALTAEEFIKKITNPVLPKLENGKIVVPKRSETYQEPKSATNANEEEVYHKRDIAIVQLEDMGEKIVELTENIDKYINTQEGRTPATYRRLEEACVKYAIQLDRVNVIGRERPREARRQMLIYLDGLSTKIVQTAS